MWVQEAQNMVKTDVQRTLFGIISYLKTGIILLKQYGCGAKATGTVTLIFVTKCKL